MNPTFLFYCRSGYESELLAEIEDKLSIKGWFGYGVLRKDSGFLVYHLTTLAIKQTSVSPQSLSGQMLALDKLIFARQKLMVIKELAFDDLRDRISDVVQSVSIFCTEANNKIPQFGDIRVEYPDTEDGKSMAKFSKKFTVPLRSALRKVNLLTKGEDEKLPYLHVFFEQGDACILGISFAGDRSANLLGIKRLKFPQDAPSRSTLKLEEAITQFCNRAQQNALFVPQMTSVDLGACPGGWTYQLVSRGIRVEAVDNGAMDERLMATGLVDYHAADGFSYRPTNGHVDWLVCDMIEQPDKVANLMLKWLSNTWCSAAIFNLKLPMKKRYQTLSPIIEQFQSELVEQEHDMYMRAKHLYHNRDEVTFMIIRNTQMCAEFS